VSPDAAVITAVYDDYDEVKPALPQLGLDVEWILVTDDPGMEAFGWNVVVEPLPGVHPNRAAKGPKFHPQQYTDAPASVWVDASFRVRSRTFVADVLGYARPLAQFVHPWRQCIYEEVLASAGLPKYAGEPMEAQVEYYRSLGHPEYWGLWATGVIARRHTPEMIRMGAWWDLEVNDWSFQDQLSQPHVLRGAGLRPAGLPGTHFSNPWLSYEGSVRH
jgi:hypothetical protein